MREFLDREDQDEHVAKYSGNNVGCYGLHKELCNERFLVKISWDQTTRVFSVDTGKNDNFLLNTFWWKPSWSH